MAWWKRRRNTLMALQDGRCYWCFRKVEIIRGDVTMPPPDHMATIDHLYDKYDSRRQGYVRGETPKCVTVLACYKCNNSRGQQTARDAVSIRESMLSVAIERIRELGIGNQRGDLFTKAECSQVLLNVIDEYESNSSRASNVCGRLRACVILAMKYHAHPDKPLLE
jgi:hypothetical protein